MRRLMLATTGVAVLAGSLVLAEPLVGAATLKPGTPTKVKAVVVNHVNAPLQTGSVKVTWTAPKVVKGKTAKATWYFVQCGSVKATTTKTTVVLKNVAKAPKTVQCTVQAKAAKVSGKPVKANAVSVYTAQGVLVLGLNPDWTTKLGAPAVAWEGAMLLPTSDDIETSNAKTISSYGTVAINGAVLKNISVTEDATSTADTPVINVTGVDSTGATVTIGQARDLNTTTFTFTLYAPTDTASVAWYQAHGVSFATSSEVIGAFTAFGKAEL